MKDESALDFLWEAVTKTLIKRVRTGSSIGSFHQIASALYAIGMTMDERGKIDPARKLSALLLHVAKDDPERAYAALEASIARQRKADGLTPAPRLDLEPAGLPGCCPMCGLGGEARIMDPENSI